ncbi:MAG: methionine--tRNA ligase [archaeon]
MVKKKFYITTAIDYVNARPHIGHAFEKVLADALARYKKQKKYDVFFLTGVDENAQKNVQAAEKAGVSVKKFIDTNTGFFIELVKALNISHDKFIRTSAKEHAKVVHEILKKVTDKGDIYKGKYEGLYCSGCEGYITEKELVDGKCPEHNKKPEFMSEEAYFFKLGKYRSKLIEFIEKYIVPESKKKEILFRLKEGLNDLCVSRKGANLGVDFPGDKKYKVYVWIDALINYISGAKEKWPADVHVIGKGINWFHSVIWPAILMSADYKLPKTLLVHGYLNIAGKKISKSLGNTIDPLKLLEKYSADSVRYSLLKCSVFEDSDYSEEILITRHNNELANKLGNLVSRVSGLIEKNGIQKTQNKLIKKLNEKKIEKLIENYEFDKALNEIFAFIDLCNEYVQSKKPWETKDEKVLFELKESILKIAELLWPFIPESSEKIKNQFSVKNIKKQGILFEKIK